MSDTKALQDVVETALANWGNGEAQDAFEELVGRLRSAEADNAALYSALSLAITGAKGRGLVAAHWSQINETAHADHPGAALLEEVEGLRNRVKEVEDDLRRSVAARLEQQTTHNAALEEAEGSLFHLGFSEDAMGRETLHRAMGRIRALKKTGQGA